jgi:hypothetical protein
MAGTIAPDHPEKEHLFYTSGRITGVHESAWASAASASLFRFCGSSTNHEE